MCGLDWCFFYALSYNTSSLTYSLIELVGGQLVTPSLSFLLTSVKAFPMDGKELALPQNGP